MSATSDAGFSGSDRALMVISDATIGGSTRLQKYGFLLAQQYKKETRRVTEATPALKKFYDDWEPLWFGPFSKSLAADIDKCVKDGLIHKEQVSTLPDSYRYSLTVKGRAKWRKMMDKSGDDITAIREKVVHLQRMSLGSLLEGIYGSYPEYTVKSVIKDKIHGG